MDGYRHDLAYIHETAFARLAVGATAALIRQLPEPHDELRTIVDLGCGGGTFAKRMHDAGYNVIGYDASEAMIELARTHVPEATFVVQSFVDVIFPPCIAVTAIGEVFNYLFDERNNAETLRQVLDRIFTCLCPGGILLFDIAGLDRAEAQPMQTFATNVDWTVLVNTSQCGDILTRKIISFRRVSDVYRRSEEEHRLRLIDPAMVSELLMSSGFEVTKCTTYGDQPLPHGLHAFVARKSFARTA